MHLSRKSLLQQRAAVAREIKAESRKRKKVVEKARSLSNDDLIGILAGRAAAAKAKAKATFPLHTQITYRWSIACTG